ncbi:IPT domain containing protein [Flavobacteriaceae bacterium]
MQKKLLLKRGSSIIVNAKKKDKSTRLKKLILLLVVFIINQYGFSEVPKYETPLIFSKSAPTAINTSVAYTPLNAIGGIVNFAVTKMIAGNTYRVSNSQLDTQLAIYSDLLGTLATNNVINPACKETLSSIDFTPTANGTYYMQINRSNFANSTSKIGTITITLLTLANTIPNDETTINLYNSDTIANALTANCKIKNGMAEVSSIDRLIAAPSNDLCTNATLLTVNPSLTCTTSTSGTTVSATLSLAGCAGNADDDVWYKFNATATSHIVTVTPSTIVNVVFEVFSGICTGVTNIVCVDNTGAANVETTTLTGLTIGTTYLVRVYSNGGAAKAGTFSICVTTIPTPANNLCTNATALPCGTTTLAGTTVGTIATGITGCTMSTNGVWYTFVGDGSSTTISTTGTAGFDQEMSIGSGSCGSLSNIACQDIFGGNGSETYTFTTVSGTTYYVYVAYYDTTTTTGTFTITRTCTTPPAITSFTPTFGCVGSTITINGANFTGATAVTIGNTAVSSITSITATQILAVVGAGTTGTVKVTTPGGTGTSVGTFTVNPLPTAVTVATAGTYCASTTLTASGGTGGTIYWQNTTPNGTSTTTLSSSQLVSASGTYYFRAQSALGCWGTQGSAAVTISAGPIITTQPISVAIAAGANTSFSIVAAGSTSYSWQVSTDGGSTWSLPITNSAPYSTATTATLNITNATALMNGYKYRATATNTCGSTISSTGTLTIMQTTLVPFTGNNSVSCGSSTNLYDHAGSTTVYSASADGYTVLENSGTGIITLNGSYVTEAGYDYIFIYSGVGITGTLLYTYSGTGTITQVVSTAGQAITVQFSTDGSLQYAGFNFSAIYSGACAVCGNTPSNLTTPAITTTTATLTWTAASPAPSNGYQWEVRTSGAGGSGGVGLTSSGSTLAAVTTANATGLTANTTYYYYVRSFCGGIDYSAWASSSSFYTGYCASTSSASTYYISNFVTTGGVSNISNNSAGYSATGYGNFTGQSASNYTGTTTNYTTTWNTTGGVGYGLWIDWNNDLDFADVNEAIYVSGAYNFTTSYSGSISVPGGTATGNYRMRTKIDYNLNAPLTCGAITGGETEDYTFTVVALTPPAITSLSAASGCVGSTITINGSNFTGATAVTIGMTAVSSITSITATQIVAVVGSGTTGLVKVTTPGGTGTSGSSFTVNPIPTVAAITGVSTVCPSASITLSDATPSGVWSVINGTGTLSIISTTGVLTAGTVGTVTVYYTVTASSCSTAVNFPVTISVGPIITTQPISVVIAAGANTSFSIVASGVTSYSWQVSTNGGSTWSLPITNSAPYSTATTNSLTITAATALMNGYKYRATATNTCGSTTSSVGTLSVSQFTLVPSTGNNAVSCGASTLLYDHAGSTTNYSNNADGYTVLENSGTGIITLNGSYVTEAGYDYIYIYAGIGTNGTLLNTYNGTGNITQVVSTAGQSITVQFTSDGSIRQSGFNFTVVYSGTCAVCGNMATNLTTSAITSTTATLSWKAATPAPSGGYEWEVRTSGAGGSGPSGLTASGSTAAGILTTNVTGLTPNTTYYYYVRNSCGGSIYSTWASSNSFTTLTTPPINNLCANASSLPCGTTALAGTTAGAIATGVTVCDMSDNGVWYSFAGDGNSTTISATGTGIGFNLEMAIMSGSCSSYSNIACIDTAGSLGTETFTFTSVIGLTYYVYVAYRNKVTDTGTFTITRTCIIPPVNNLCANATALPCGTTAMAGTTVDTNTILVSTGCTMSNNGVWYTFVGDGNSTTITTTGTAGFNQEMGIASGSCGSLLNVICMNTSAGDGIETHTFTTVSGTTYYVYVAHQATGTTTGAFTISRTCPVITACVTPTTQPTSLVFNPITITITSINGSFTAAVPAPSNYLVVANTTGTAPTLVNGTNYAIGSTILGNTNVIVDTDANTTFSSTGLLGSTKYYFYVYSNSNTGCTGGPLYLATSPLTNYATTSSPTYCSPEVSTNKNANSIYFTTISFVGTLNDVSNTSTFSIILPKGYQDFTGVIYPKAIQAQGQGINITTQINPNKLGFLKAWIDWNKDGDFTDSGELVYDTGNIAVYSTTLGFVIPATQAIGDYRIRLRTNDLDSSNWAFDSCELLSTKGETEDYLFTVIANCATVITSVTDGVKCGTGNVNLAATGSAGVTSFKWYNSITGGTLLATTGTGAYTTTSISATTTYYVTAVKDCESLVRTAVIATINPVPTLSFTPISPIVCGENTAISLTAAGDKQQMYLINENFESGGLGAFNNINNIDNGATINGDSAWQNKSSTYVPVNPPGQVWFPAISSGFGTNRFVISSSDFGPYKIDNTLISNTLNSTNYQNLTLTFDEYYSHYSLDGTNGNTDYVKIDVSIDGGTTWIQLQKQIADVAIGTRFQNKSFDLTSYKNESNLKIRFKFHGEWCDGVAIDNVKLYGDVLLNTAFNWTSATPVDAYTDVACTTSYVAGTPALSVYVKPTLTQLELGFFVFTANAVLSNGCNVNQQITVTNNSKIWQGATANWSTAANWKPSGVPTADSCVIIPDLTLISGSSYQAYAKNLTVKSTGNLEVAPGNNITVTDWVNVKNNGQFYLRNNASLVQINNDANTVTGTFKMERTSQPMKRTSYTYWNSPVKMGAFTLGTLSPGSIYYSWTPSIGNSFGNWQGVSAASIMDHQNGYIIRAPSTYSTTVATAFTGNFVGTPNNGDVFAPITYGTSASTSTDPYESKWNLIGNPYPSAINANLFLTRWV